MTRMSPLPTLLILLLFTALPATASPAPAAVRDYTLTGPDGTAIAVQEAGDPRGRPIVFVHGLLGSHLNWAAQMDSPLLQRYRLITYDLRGHGLSGRPRAAEAYTDGRRWAADLATVLVGVNVDDPVLVGWSLGAAVITNYLAEHGDAEIAGALYVGGVIELDPSQIAAHPQVYDGLAASDLGTHLDAEREFIALCFEIQPDTTTFQRLLAGAAMASPDMQAVVQEMTIDAPAGIGTLRKPLLLLYGAHDALVRPEPSIARARALDPAARSLLYAASDHAPFLEEPGRFNRDLATFVEAVAP